MKTKVRNLSSRMPTAEPTSRRLRPLTLALSCVLLTACAAVGPDYREPPPVDIGNGWTLPLASESQSADLARWWSALDDPILDRLMGTALAQNLDLRQAAARIDEARALRDRVAELLAADAPQGLAMSLAFAAVSAALGAVVSQLSDRGSKAFVDHRHRKPSR